MSVFDFTSKEKEELFRIFNSRETGFKKDEASALQKTFGLNEVKTKEVSFVNILFRQFKSAFFYLLFIAAIIAFALGQNIEGLLILLFASINVLFGFFQEYHAQKAVNALKQYSARQAKVIRNNKEQIIDSRFLVPGDIVILEAGDVVASDLRLLESSDLAIDESVLTGESQPVNKTSDKILNIKAIFEARNIAFSGTAVVSGEGKGIVINTGNNTEFGKVAKLSASLIRPSIYEKELVDFSKIIFKTVFITFLVIFALNLILKRQPDLSYFIIFCLALIVGIIPEALPVVVSSSLSRGALRLLRKKVVVKRLSSIEDLGDMEILCTDKTGTLTENKLKAETIVSEDKDKCLLYALLVSPFLKKEILSNPFDLAISQEIKDKNSAKDFKLIEEAPFDFKRLRNTVLLKNQEGKRILISRGAAEAILGISNQFDHGLDKNKLGEEIKNREKQGERILAVAFKEISPEENFKEADYNLRFLGYISFSDPLKETAHLAVKLAKKLKVKIKIITGDSKEVAGKIALDVGLIDKATKVISGTELENLSEEELMKKCEEFSVFARIAPETKLKIIQILQKKYEVGFLGEGINDAPALKAAHVGIAVKEATDVSRDAADILLLDSDLKVVIEGIKEGRIIFANINKYIKCTLSANFGNFYSIAIMSLILPFLPMLPPQILLENILSDAPLISISNDSVDIQELRRPKVYALSKTFPYIFILALISSAFDFIFLAIFHQQPQALIQTLWFTLSLITEIILIFSIRTRHVFWKTAKPAKILVISSISIVIFTLLLPFLRFGRTLFSFSPPQVSSLLIICLLGLAYLLANELAKKLYFSRH